jgi:hypothetical protein
MCYLCNSPPISKNAGPRPARPQEENDSIAQSRRGEPTVSSIFLERWRRLYFPLMGVVALVALGCQSTPIDLADGPAPLRIPRPGGPAKSFEDSLTGGEVFSMYCNQCHNARALAERPFLNYENVMAHMRVRANLTGVEYEKLLEFLRRWHDVTAPTPPVEPSPKRVIFPQPISELRDEISPQANPAAAAQPAPGQADVRLEPAPAQGNLQPIPAPAGAIPAPAGP